MLFRSRLRQAPASESEKSIWMVWESFRVQQFGNPLANAEKDFQKALNDRL